ncbi:hypothetical protein J3R82DRAFT_8483 [Butyriboletus roseoflavus]|nr:hypothetical protein J3R82DRAFT_8483 [Butyriboletus roseoflavus]
MVVTRRTPLVPPPPLARNHSQGTQRPPQRPSLANDTASVLKNAPSSVAAAYLAGSSNGNKDHHSGLDNNAGKKSKKSRRHGRNKHQQSNFQAFLNFLTKLLLLAFTVYTFSVCPQDTHLQSPICRGLTEYKRIVLDPYIIPPLQAVLVHPSVAPYIERAKPYVHRAAEITTPIILRTQQEWKLHVVPQWEKRIVPEWNKRVVPQWNKHVVPQWDKHVASRLELVQSTLEPYRLRVTQEYEQRIAPRAQVAIYNLQRWQRQAQPYVLLAVSKTKDRYYATKPYAAPLAKRLGHLLQQFALFLREQRQKFVDPHVAEMWEKVKELSRGRQVVHEATPEHESLSSDTLFTILETLAYETTVSSTDPFTSAYHATSIPEQTTAYILSSLSASETAEVESHSTLPEPTSSPEPETSTSTELVDTSTGIESFLSAESVPAETLHESEPPTSGASAIAEEVDTATSSVLAAATVTSSSRLPPVVEEPTKSSAAATPSKISVPAASATVPPASSRADDEIDFDAFYAELGLDEPLENSGDSEEYNSGPPSPPVETEEERAEHLRLKTEETARKRADIEARQAKWEAELQVQMEQGTSQLQNRLGNLRTAAAAELSSSAEVRSSIEELVGEAEKYLKGAEIYLKNIKGENRRSDEKLALWDRVAERVNDKFSDRLLATKEVVNDWYGIVLDKELQEVATVTAAVREVAEKGQLDLGLDYAWLEDVTYNDWQRYHALIGTSEQYAHEAASIQNGTHPQVVVANPMSPIVEDLESEVQDVVIGFETRLRRIKRDGERAFNNYGNGVAQKEEEKGTSVEPEAGVRGEEQGFTPPVVIGRSQEEVLEALGKVELVGEAEHSASGSRVEPEEAVSPFIGEMGGGAEIHHTEL